VQDSRFSGLTAVLVQSLKQASTGRAGTGFSARGASFSRYGVFVFLAACSSVSRGVEAWIACGNRAANGPDRVLGFWIPDT
jgi:hypothetical protein